jgi:hypothetical protein
MFTNTAKENRRKNYAFEHIINFLKYCKKIDDIIVRITANNLLIHSQIMDKAASSLIIKIEIYLS